MAFRHRIDGDAIHQRRVQERVARERQYDTGPITEAQRDEYRRRAETSLAASHRTMTLALSTSCAEHDANRGGYCFTGLVRGVCGARLATALANGYPAAREPAIVKPHYRHSNRIGSPR